MRHFVLLISLLAVVAVIAGCGGSSDSSNTTSSTSDGSSNSTTTAGGDESGAELLAKSEFITEADEICKRTQEETASLGAKYIQLGESANSPADLKKLAGVVRELLAYAEKGINEVQGLEEPAADRQAIEDYVATIKKRIATGEEFADAVETGKQSEANSLLKAADDIIEDAEAQAKSYGFSVCGISK